MTMTRFDQFVDNLVTYMSMATPTNKHARRIPLLCFTRAYPLLNGVDSLESATRETIEFAWEAQVADLSTPFDQAVLMNLVDDRTRDVVSDVGRGFSMVHVRRVSREAARGRVPDVHMARPIYALEMGIVNTDGEYTLGHRSFYALGKGTVMLPGMPGRLDPAARRMPVPRWMWIGPRSMPGDGAVRATHHLPGGFFDPEPASWIHLATIVQFTRELYWTVELGYDGKPSIQFPTDAIGAREAFRLRDIPEGKSRRAALIHWVRHHWRARRSGPGATEVRTHLRGQERFSWNGLRCVITPTASDLKKAGRVAADTPKRHEAVQ